MVEVDRRTRQTRRAFAPQSRLSCAIVVILDNKKRGFYVTVLICSGAAEQDEGRTWRTSAPRLDPWYRSPTKPGHRRTAEHALNLYNGVGAHETLPRASLSKVNAGIQPRV